MEENLRFVNRVQLAAFVLILGLALPFAPVRVWLGAVLGSGIVLLNFLALAFLLRRAFRAGGKLSGPVMGLYLLKIVLLFSAVGLCLAYAPIDRLAFLGGTMVFVLAMAALAVRKAVQGAH